MGGYGSGGHNSRYRTVDECRSINIGRLHKRGCLQRGHIGSLHWSNAAGEQVSSIGFSCDGDRLELSYRVRSNGGDNWHDVEESVPITWAACRFGGHRPFFECPGVVNGRHCGRLVLKLYRAGRYFLCRHCCRLTYASRQEIASSARSGAPTRSVRAWVAILATRLRSHRGPRGCTSTLSSGLGNCVFRRRKKRTISSPSVRLGSRGALVGSGAARQRDFRAGSRT